MRDVLWFHFLDFKKVTDFLKNESSPVVLTIYISHTIVYNVNSYAFEILLSDAIVLDMSVAYIKKNVMVYVFNS